MPTIDTLTHRAVAISPETPGADVYDRFCREPDTLVIPVVEDDRPVGLIERNAFLVCFGSKYGRALFARRPVRLVMDAEPVTVEMAMAVSDFCESMLAERASSLLRGFIVTDQGRYHGVGTVLALLQATSAAGRLRSEQLAESVRSLGVAKTQAQASTLAKSQFLGLMSHELRTPMNGVLAMAELLRRQPLGPDAQAYVQTIIDSSETLLRILADALDLSRAEGGELELSPKPVFANAIMDDVQALWSPRATQDGVSLMVRYEGDPDLAIDIDIVRLKQVFNNLVGNALKLARNGVVEAGLKAIVLKDGVRLEARVRDNGPSSPDDSLDHVFDPFSDSTTSRGAVTGLSMAICRQIVERMGGRIWAERNIGRGSTFGFEVSVPRAAMTRSGASNVSELAELKLQSEPHILIVDDNATNRVVAQALCEMFGCTSESAEDGLEAVEAMKTRRFDLVLMDIKMPRMDGVQATLAIRALPGAERDTPILALTANADPEDAKRYLSIGMAAVVEKPIKPERLRQAMNIALASLPETAEQTDDEGRICA